MEQTTPFATHQHQSRLGRCDGCKHNWYSASGGQALKPEPHSRCTALQQDIPMVLDARGSWLHSLKPENCPERLGQPCR